VPRRRSPRRCGCLHTSPRRCSSMPGQEATSGGGVGRRDNEEMESQEEEGEGRTITLGGGCASGIGARLELGSGGGGGGYIQAVGLDGPSGPFSLCREPKIGPRQI
jgi:hypothetical protein